MFIHFRCSPWFTLNLIHLFIFISTCFDLFIVFLLWLWHPVGRGWRRRLSSLSRGNASSGHGHRWKEARAMVSTASVVHHVLTIQGQASMRKGTMQVVQIIWQILSRYFLQSFLSNVQTYSFPDRSIAAAGVILVALQSRKRQRGYETSISLISFFLHVMFGDPNHARLEVSASSSDSSVPLTERGTSVLKSLNLCTLFAVRDLQNLQDGCAEGVWLLWQSGWVAWLVSCQAPSFQVQYVAGVHFKRFKPSVITSVVAAGLSFGHSQQDKLRQTPGVFQHISTHLAEKAFNRCTGQRDCQDFSLMMGKCPVCWGPNRILHQLYLVCQTCPTLRRAIVT